MLNRKVFEHNGDLIEYIFDTPKDFDVNKKYPVIFYLHGYGFVNTDFDALIARCPLRRERIPDDLPFILVVPKCNKQSWIFNFERLCAFVNEIINLPSVDKEKVYLTGSSMGGYTCWMLLQAHKEWFTAATICCGGGQYWAGSLGAFNDVAIKAVHGALDTTVLPRESEIMAKRINQAGGNVELIIYPELAHDVWTKTFEDKKTYYWFLEQNIKEIKNGRN